jgi:hypothetical protein
MSSVFNAVAYNENGFKQGLKDTIGLTEFKRKNDVLTDAVKDPKLFLESRTKAIASATKAIEEASIAFYQHLDPYDLAQPEKESRTLAYGEATKDLYLKEIELKFPTGAIDNSVARLQNEEQNRRVFKGGPLGGFRGGPMHNFEVAKSAGKRKKRRTKSAAPAGARPVKRAKSGRFVSAA